MNTISNDPYIYYIDNKIRLQMQYAMVDQLALSDTINITVNNTER